MPSLITCGKMGVPAIVPLILKLTPNWKKMKSNATSLPYDAAICGDFKIPDKLIRSLHYNTFVIESTKSPKMLRECWCGRL